MGERIGVDLGGTKIEALVLDPSGAELARKRIATPRTYEATIDAIAELVASLASGAASIGVGMPGSISRRTGLVKNANSTWLNGRPFHRDLEARIGRPIRVANDADCLALSESVDGAGKEARVVFAAILGTGCGAGIAVERRPLQGPNGVAGEWGHNPLPWPEPNELPGPACYCGKHGCLETWLSGPGLARDHGGGLDAAAVVAQASRDPSARAALDRYVSRLARGLAHVINVLDPDAIVLGGGMSNAGELYERLPVLLPPLVFGGEADTPVARALHGDSSGVRGAAWLWPST
jgi:fructokinase